jgi:hypothetical protein
VPGSTGHGRPAAGPEHLISPMRRSWLGRAEMRESNTCGRPNKRDVGRGTLGVSRHSRCCGAALRLRAGAVRSLSASSSNPALPGCLPFSAFLGRFLPKLGGASRCRPFFACAGGTRHGRLCHVSTGPATYVILRHDSRPLAFRLFGILVCRPKGARQPAGNAQSSADRVVMSPAAGTRCGLGTGRSSCSRARHRHER